MRNRCARPPKIKTRSTSVQALAGIRKSRETNAKLVVEELKKHSDAGLTAKELQIRLKMDHSITSRINELVAAGWVVRTEEKRRNPPVVQQDGTVKAGGIADVLIVPKHVRDGGDPVSTKPTNFDGKQGDYGPNFCDRCAGESEAKIASCPDCAGTGLDRVVQALIKAREAGRKDIHESNGQDQRILVGPDAQHLAADLDKGCDAREWQRRVDEAHRTLNTLLNQPITLRSRERRTPHSKAKKSRPTKKSASAKCRRQPA